MMFKWGCNKKKIFKFLKPPKNFIEKTIINEKIRREICFLDGNTVS